MLEGRKCRYRRLSNLTLLQNSGVRVYTMLEERVGLKGVLFNWSFPKAVADATNGLDMFAGLSEFLAHTDDLYID